MKNIELKDEEAFLLLKAIGRERFIISEVLAKAYNEEDANRLEIYGDIWDRIVRQHGF